MDRLRKIIYIIVGTLTAILLTFSLMKKIGLCAEAEPLPIYVNESNYINEYNIPIERIKEIVAENVNENRYVARYVNDNGVLLRIIEWKTQPNIYNANDLNQTPITTTTAINKLSQNQSTYFGISTNPPTVKITWITIEPNGTYTKTSENTYNFFTLSSTTIQYNYILASGDITNGVDGKPIFKVQPPHTKGGVLAEMTENNEIVTEELPQIDTTAPSTDTNANWYQKILNALGGIGKRIQNDTLTTGWYLNEIKEGNRNFFLDITALLGTALPSITEKLDAIIGYNREQAQENREDWLEGYQTSAIKSIADTGHSYRETLSQIGQRNSNRLIFGVWRLEYNGNDLHLIGNYTMPQIFSGQTVQQDISFAWYNQVRNYVVRVFKVLLYVGFAWYLLTQVPNMIKGASGPARKIGDEAK